MKFPTRWLIRAAIAGASLSIATTLSSATAMAAPKVVVSIKPIHSLVSGVMQGIGEPDLIVEGAGSPHSYSLKPSQAAKLANADIVFWVGHDLEPFLEKPIETLGDNATVVELSEVGGLTLLAAREGGPFEEHDHGDEHAADEDHDHHDEETDPHLWLDPINAEMMTQAIAATLAAADPQNAAAYSTNAQAVIARLDALTKEINATVEPLRGKPFIVFHDAYHYFENRFGLSAAGSITVTPDVMPGAERVGQIRDKLAATQATCVFAEPQFEPKLISIVTEGTDARSGVLDPLGAALKPGQDLYFQLLRNMATALTDCLGQAG